VLEIVIVLTNDDVDYNVCPMKSPIKKANYLQVSIVTLKNIIIFLIKGKWLEVVVNMLKLISSFKPKTSSFFNQDQIIG
jgi:hypothetical protein